MKNQNNVETVETVESLETVERGGSFIGDTVQSILDDEREHGKVGGHSNEEERNQTDTAPYHCDL